MKTENFDDSIRRKLEDIDPIVREEDIDRVHQFINANRSKTSHIEKRGNKILASLLGLIILSLLAWNIYLTEKHQKLSETMKNLQDDLNSAKLSTTAKGSGDTLFIIKYTEFSGRGAIKEESQIIKGSQSKVMAFYNSIAKKDNALHDINNQNRHLDKNNSEIRNNMPDHTADKPVTDLKIFPYNQHQDSQGNKIYYSIKENHESRNKPMNKTAEQISYNRRFTEMNNQGTYQKSIGLTLSNSSYGKNAYKITQMHMESAITDPSDNHIPSFKINQASEKTATGFTIQHEKDRHNKDSVLTIKNMSEAGKDTISAHSMNPPENKKNNGLLRNINYNIGLGFEMANTQLAISIMGEIYLHKSISITSGIKYMSISEQYDDDDDFMRKKNMDIKKLYSVSDSASLSEITMRYSVTQIPIALNYYYSLRNDYSIMFSLGTDIDVSAKLMMGYRSINNMHYNDDERKNLQTKYHPIALNNAVLAIGIQKEWKRLITQVTPFLSPQLKNVEYKNNNIYYGIRCRILYKF
jgi:hypothetical protein